MQRANCSFWVRVILSSIGVGLPCLAFSPNAGAEIWRCGDNSFTTRAEASEGCAPLADSQVCGSGQNRFITPLRPGMQPRDITCAANRPATSPIVHTADLQSETQSLRNWERKFSLPALHEEAHKSAKGELDEQLGELQDYLSMIPGGSQVLKSLASEGSK